jgi:periplasmic copper chaperone A
MVLSDIPVFGKGVQKPKRDASQKRRRIRFGTGYRWPVACRKIWGALGFRLWFPLWSDAMRKPAVLFAAWALSACHAAPRELGADQAWVRLPAVSGRPGAAYFVLHGGREGAVLNRVTAPFAARAEMHTEMRDGATSAMSMAPMRDVAVPAGGTVPFAPTGRHVMLFDVAPGLKPGGTAPLTLSFAGGRQLTVQARLVSAGDPPPRF